VALVAAVVELAAGERRRHPAVAVVVAAVAARSC